jgi:hypothetical protein
VLLAAAYWAGGRRNEFHRHLLAAVQTYDTVWLDYPQEVPARESLPYQERIIDDDLEGYLARLEGHWNSESTAVAMVRSALAGLFPQELPLTVVHEIHLPLLLAVGSRGCVKMLALQWLQRTSAGHSFFPDPVALGCTVLASSFLKGLAPAWQYAQRAGALDLFGPGSWVRSRVEPLGGTPWLQGESAGASRRACVPCRGVGISTGSA